MVDAPHLTRALKIIAAGPDHPLIVARDADGGSRGPSRTGPLRMERRWRSPRPGPGRDPRRGPRVRDLSHRSPRRRGGAAGAAHAAGGLATRRSAALGGARPANAGRFRGRGGDSRRHRLGCAAPLPGLVSTARPIARKPLRAARGVSPAGTPTAASPSNAGGGRGLRVRDSLGVSATWRRPPAAVRRHHRLPGPRFTLTARAPRAPAGLGMYGFGSSAHVTTSRSAGRAPQHGGLRLHARACPPPARPRASALPGSADVREPMPHRTEGTIIFAPAGDPRAGGAAQTSSRAAARWRWPAST